VSATSSGGQDGTDGTDGWQHLHPLSPLLRGGIAFLAVLAYLVSQQADAVFGARDDDPLQGHVGVAAVGVLVVLSAIVAGSWVSWRFSRFRVASDLIELRTGFVFRQHRQVRFDRIQAVDVGRPLLARLTGLSEVVVQSAGGSDSQLKLSFLADARAQDMREQLIELARRSDEGELTHGGHGPLHAAPGAAAQHPADGAADRVLRIPNPRILQSILYSGQGATLLLVVPALVVSVLAGVGEMIAWLGPMTLALGSATLRRLTQESNFELLHQGDRLRIRHGLTDLRTTTVPVHRIQAIEVSQPLPWRLTQWWRVEINVAGAGGDDDVTQSVLMPVGTLQEALAVVTLVRPALPREELLAALEGEGPEGGFVTATERARVLDPLSWRRRGYAVVPDGVLTRRGVLYRAAQYVPHARIQSLKLTQGPLERSRGVATVRLVSTRGPVSPLVAHLDTAQAEQLVDQQVARSSHARRLAA
jgi:putative membrane protein